MDRREITEAVRIRNELYQLEDQLRGVRSWASSLERRGATESVRDVISVRVTDLEVRWREKHGKYKALVSGLKQDNLWPQPVDRDQQRARLADVAERASKLHDMLARLNLAEPRSAGRMDVGGARHKTGSKRRFSAVSSDPEHLPPAASASQGKERTTVGPSLEGITHQLNGAEANHTRESESVKVRTNKVAEDLRQLALERDAAVDSYAQLLQRVAAAEEQLRELGEALPELKAGRDAAIGQLDAARAEHELLRKMVREVGAPLSRPTAPTDIFGV